MRLFIYDLCIYKYIFFKKFLNHRLKQLNIGRRCWTQVEVAGLKVETAYFYVFNFVFQFYIIYVLLDVEER